MIVYLSHWFIREDRAKATSTFMAAIPLSFVIGSPLAGWILGHIWFGYAGWRWLFVMEGIPAILLGAVSFFFLTDWPHQATWLAPTQRDWIQHRLREEAPSALPRNFRLARSDISHDSAARHRHLHQLSGDVQFCFLDPDHAETLSGLSTSASVFWGRSLTL